MIQGGLKKLSGGNFWTRLFLEALILEQSWPPAWIPLLTWESLNCLLPSHFSVQHSHQHWWTDWFTQPTQVVLPLTLYPKKTSAFVSSAWCLEKQSQFPNSETKMCQCHYCLHMQGTALTGKPGLWTSGGDSIYISFIPCRAASDWHRKRLTNHFPVLACSNNFSFQE